MLHQPGYSAGKFAKPSSLLQEPRITNHPDRDNNATLSMSSKNLNGLSTDGRLEMFRKYLVSEMPIKIQEPASWSDEGTVKRFLLLKQLLSEDEAQRNLIQEARNVFYEENAFIISWHGLSHFLNDILGDWTDAVPVELLVRKLTVLVERRECQCGRLTECMRHTCNLAKFPNLELISFKWSTVIEASDVHHSEEQPVLLRRINDDLHGDDADDVDDSDYSDDSEATIRWGPSDDETWVSVNQVNQMIGF
ncbi:hypothetical protein NCS52_01578200 [Fusarium sp. LHS14.1]|nr:hypothetical protein NCS52_01578200 [Fusarium sp. LHS14.1]